LQRVSPNLLMGSAGMDLDGGPLQRGPRRGPGGRRTRPDASVRMRRPSRRGPAGPGPGGPRRRAAASGAGAGAGRGDRLRAAGAGGGVAGKRPHPLTPSPAAPYHPPRERGDVTESIRLLFGRTLCRRSPSPGEGGRRGGRGGQGVRAPKGERDRIEIRSLRGWRAATARSRGKEGGTAGRNFRRRDSGSGGGRRRWAPGRLRSLRDLRPALEYTPVSMFMEEDLFGISVTKRRAGRC